MEPPKFWDGFQWIIKTNCLPTIDSNLMSQTRKMRRVQISNLPLYLGLVDKDIADIVNKVLIENYLNDPGNNKPVVST